MKKNHFGEQTRRVPIEVWNGIIIEGNLEGYRKGKMLLKKFSQRGGGEGIRGGVLSEDKDGSGN